MIFTSYFGSKAPRERKVCIAKYGPRYWSGPMAKRLAPSNPKALFWKAAYLADLEERFPSGEGLMEYLDEICRRVPNPILCCYEREPELCHRSILADYARQWINVEMHEWEPDSTQLSLI